MEKSVFNRSGGRGRLPGSFVATLSVLGTLFLAAPTAQAEGNPVAAGYVQRNLVSDGSIPAEHTDPNLINPWGLALTPTGMVWIAANGTSATMVYDGQGKAMHQPPLTLEIPGGNPTGIVANEGAEFEIPSEDGTPQSAIFIFATEGGIISAWSYAVDPANAIPVIDNTEGGAVYKGLALAANGTDRFLYATDFHGNRVDVFDSNFRPVKLPDGAFQDPGLPPGYAPFGIHNVNGSLYVTYARQNEGKDEAHPGPGTGFINVFNADGQLIRRLVSQDHLDAPWGLAMAPADFGQFSNHLLVANSGDGRISAFNPATGEFRGHLRFPDSRPVIIEGLWGIRFGNGVREQPTNALFFTAGPGQENQGLYGRIEQSGGLLAAGTRLAPAAEANAAEEPAVQAEATEDALQKADADAAAGEEKPAVEEQQTAQDSLGKEQPSEAVDHEEDKAAGTKVLGTQEPDASVEEGVVVHRNRHAPPPRGQVGAKNEAAGAPVEHRVVQDGRQGG